MRYLYAIVVLWCLLFLWAFDVSAKTGRISIEPCVKVSWDMTTNHVYTLWIADEVGGAYYKHPAFTEYTPTSNRTGHLHSDTTKPTRFFKLEVDGVVYAAYPPTNAVMYAITISTNGVPPLP